MLDRLLDGLAKAQGFQLAVPPEKTVLQGDISVDYSWGSGAIYGGHYYQWRIGNSPLPSEKPKSN